MSYCAVNAIGELAPHLDRLVTIDRTKRDMLERPIPVINYGFAPRHGIGGDRDHRNCGVGYRAK